MLSTVLIVLLTIQQSVPNPQLEARSLFVNDNLAWALPTTDLEKSYALAENGSIIILRSTGEFAIVSCTLFRDRKSGRLSVCQGCGLSIRKGSWKQDADRSITVQSRLTYTGARQEGGSLPGPEIVEQWRIKGGCRDGRVLS